MTRRRMSMTGAHHGFNSEDTEKKFPRRNSIGSYSHTNIGISKLSSSNHLRSIIDSKDFKSKVVGYEVVNNSCMMDFNSCGIPYHREASSHNLNLFDTHGCKLQNQDTNPFQPGRMEAHRAKTMDSIPCNSLCENDSCSQVNSFSGSRKALHHSIRFKHSKADDYQDVSPCAVTASELSDSDPHWRCSSAPPPPLQSAQLKKSRKLFPSSPPDHTQHSLFNTRLNTNDRRKLRREEQLCIVTDDLIDMVCDIYAAESQVLLYPAGCDPVKEWCCCTSPCELYRSQSKDEGAAKLHNLDALIVHSIRHFIHSLPPRYALGIESPGEVLVHMRLVAKARKDNTRAAVHITAMEDDSLFGCVDAGASSSGGGASVHHLQQNGHGPHHGNTRVHGDESPPKRRSFQMTYCLPKSTSSFNVRLVTICCEDTVGVLEYVMGLLVAGGSEILDCNFMLTSDRIMLIRCVVNMKGCLRLEKLESYIEVFLCSARGIPCQSCNVSEVPLAERFGQVDPRCVQYHTFQQDHVILDTATNNVHDACSRSLYQNQQRYSDFNDFTLNPLDPNYDGASPSPFLNGDTNNSNIGKNQSIPNRVNTNRSKNIESAVPLVEILGLNSSDLVSQMPPIGTSPSDVGEDCPTACTDATPRGGTNKRRPLRNRESSIDLGPSLDGLDEINGNNEKTKRVGTFDNILITGTIRGGRAINIYRGHVHDNSIKEGNSLLSKEEKEDIERLSNSGCDENVLAFKVAMSANSLDDDVVLEELQREGEVAKKLKHENICQLIDMYQTPECVCLAYEFCSQGTLASVIEDKNKCYDYLPLALDIAHGMSYLHSKNIIHRDLKPSNIFVDDKNRAKIADFGMSVTHTGEELTGETGTYRWMAPEVIRHEPYSINSDIYSFGVCLWQLVTRNPRPYGDMSPIQAAFAVAKGERPEIPAQVPEAIRRIIIACWDEDQLRRPSFAYICMGLMDYAQKAFELTVS